MGDSFVGVDVALERHESGLLLVRYGNVKLGSFDDFDSARIKPAYFGYWNDKPVKEQSAPDPNI